MKEKFLELTLCEYSRKTLEHSKGTRKWRLAIDDFRQAQFREDRDGFYSVMPPRPASWFCIMENPWHILRDLDKPDPPDDELLKAGRDWWGCRNSEDSLYAFEDFTRLIQAEIQKNEQGIEAVRKLFRNHESRMNDFEGGVDRCFARIQGSELSQDLRTLERRVEELNKAKNDLWDYIIKKEHFPGREVKPQAKGEVARCKDEKGVEHELIPGVSVIQNKYVSSDDRALFLKHSPEQLHANGGDLSCVWLTKTCGGMGGTETLWNSKTSVFLFDLDFPQDSGSSKGGNE